MRTSLRQLAASANQHSLVRNSGFLMCTTVATSLLGYVYWLIAAHTFAASQVGFAVGIVTALTLVGSVFSLGVSPLFVRMLPRLAPKEWSAFFCAGLLVASSAAGLAGLVAGALVLPRLPHFQDLHDPRLLLAFVVGCFATAGCLAFDGCFISLRRSDRQFARNLSFAAMKVPLLAAPVLVVRHPTASVVVWTWDAALVGSAVLGWFLLEPLRPHVRFAPLEGLRPFLRQSRVMLTYQLGWLGGWLPVFVFPIMVVAERGAREDAYFYFTWSIGAVFFMVSTSIASALFAEGSNRQDLEHQARLALRVMAAALLPLTILTAIFAHDLLDLFGRQYADHGTALLRICALGALPDAVTNTFVAVRQAQKRLQSVVLLNAAMAAIALLGAGLLLPVWGINAVGWSWTFAQSVGAGWIVISVLRQRRRPAVAQDERVSVPGSFDVIPSVRV